MIIESFETLGAQGTQFLCDVIKDSAYIQCNKTLSFVLFNEEQELVGFVLLKNNSVPDTYIIDGEVHTRENGVEILQIYCHDMRNEARLLHILSNRVIIWCTDGNPAFNYMWSTSLGDSTHFLADVLNGELYNVLISPHERKHLFYYAIERDGDD